jgi:hypothetical protein
MKSNAPLINASIALATLCAVSTTTAFAAGEKYGGIVIDDVKIGAKE